MFYNLNCGIFVNKIMFFSVLILGKNEKNCFVCINRQIPHITIL